MYPGFDNQTRAVIRLHVDIVIYCLRRGFGPEAFHADAGTQKINIIINYGRADITYAHRTLNILMNIIDMTIDIIMKGISWLQICVFFVFSCTFVRYIIGTLYQI